MKLLFFVSVFMPLTLVAQQDESYYKAMEKFRTFYNAGQGDSINAMFGHDWDVMKSTKENN